MVVSWASFEDIVRGIASSVWSQPCKVEHIGGVDIDGALDAAEDIKILIEITKSKDGLQKVREDISKLNTAK